MVHQSFEVGKIPGTPSSILSDITVLYVDDDPEMTRLFKRFLEKRSPLRVITAGSGPEVLDLISQNSCDVVVSDYQMPGMNGIELLQEIRRSSSLPFILFTGKGREEVVMEAINNGATFYLQKGGDPQTLYAELVHKIKAAVGNRRGELALRESEEKFRLLFNTARDGILIFKDDRIIEGNSQASVLFGINSGELTSLSVYDLSPDVQPDGMSSSEKWESCIAGVIGGVPSAIYWKFRRPDGGLFDAEAGLNRIDLDGTASIQAIIRDITDRLLAEEELSRKNAELNAAYEKILSSEEERGAYLIELESNQKKLIESERRYRELADLLPQIVYECDLNGVITYVNRQGFRTFGYPEGQLPVDLSVMNLVIPEDRVRALENMAQFPISSSSDPHEYRAFRHDGTIIPVVIYSAPIVKDEVLTGFRGIVLDISEQKRIEKAIRESERLFANVIDFLPDATFVINNEGMVIAWNRAMEQLTGFPASDFLGKGDYVYAVPFYGVARPILIDLVLKGDKQYEILYANISRIGNTIVGETFILTHADGSRYLWAAASPLWDSQGNVVGAIESIRDITDRKRAEEELVRAREDLERRVDERTTELTLVNSALNSEIEERILAETALRESQDRYQRLVDLSPNGIIVHDGMTILFINPAGSRLLGTPEPNTIIGWKISGIFYPDLIDKFRSLIESPEKWGDSTFTSEEELIRSDHSNVAVEISAAPIVFLARPAVLIMTRDITGRKHAEEQLQRYADEMADKNKELDFLANQLIDINQDLDKRVKERTDQVIRLMKQKDEFITQLGHDLKTPLTPLRALLPSLIEEEDDPETRESLAVLLRSVHSIQEQTEKILMIARLNRENVEVKSEPVLILPILLDSLQNHRISIDKKELNVSIEVSNDLSLLFSSEDAEIVFDNLIGNAAKYSLQGGSISIRSCEKDDQICILVGDEGIGLTEEEIGHVFEEFYMADSSRHDRTSSGLGLAIVRRLVGLYRGTVHVKSEGKGKGTMFYVCLPAPSTP